jgi:hypothetical protein
MAQFKYSGDQDLIFPSLGIIVRSGDVFEAPDDLTAEGVEIVTDTKSAGKASKAVSADPVTDQTTSSDAPSTDSASEPSN